MLFVAWFAVEWGSKEIEFPFEPLIGFLLSFTAWAWAEIKVDKPSSSSYMTLHPNDIKLAKKLRENFPSDTRRLLREHDFGLPYNNKLLKGAEVVTLDWKGAEFEYKNEELGNLSSEIVRLSSQLLDKLATYSGVAETWPVGHYSIPTREERGSDLFSDQTRDHIKEVEGVAIELLENLDKFERAFRKISPESFKTYRA